MPRLKHKHRVFFTVNGVIAGCIAFATFTNPHANAGTAIYVVLLSLVCTLPLLFATSYRGRASLLIVFLSYYFMTFGLGDLVRLFSYQPDSTGVAVGISWGGSIAVLLGAIFFLIGYAVTTSIPVYRTAGWSAREWSPRATAFIGVGCWVIGWIATAYTQFGAADPATALHTNPMIGGFLALTRFLRPVGSLLVIYLYLTTRSRRILILLLAITALDVGLGFFGGSKQIAMGAPVLFFLGFILLRERIPVLALVLFTLITAVFFNAFQGYRIELGHRGETRSAALTQIASGRDALLRPDTPLEKKLGGGLDYLLSRVSQKWVVDLLVERVGKGGVQYKHGSTLTPLFYIFIPRLVAPNKPNNVTGQLVNHTFSIASASTSIAITNLGDLYWNFGWTGIVVGMTIIGAFMAWAATKFRLDTNLTAPKFLFLVITIYFLILMAEGGIALVYTLWARVAVVFLLIHAFVPKKRTSASAHRRRPGGGHGGGPRGQADDATTNGFTGQST
jgi:hypothetical protein